MFAKIFVILFGMIFSMLIGIGVMIFGWGLEAKSWGVILGGYFLMLCVSTIVQIAAKSD